MAGVAAVIDSGTAIGVAGAAVTVLVAVTLWFSTYDMQPAQRISTEQRPNSRIPKDGDMVLLLII